MNSWLKIIPVFLLTFLSCISTAQETSPSCTVTYIANEGFLARTANHKILFDALFGGIKGNWCEQPGDSVMNMMLNGIPPYDNIEF